MIDQLWLIPLGFATGILGSMIGLGGGIIVVPVLTFLGIPPTVAASNSLFAAFSNSIASTISYSKQKRIEYSLGLKLGLLAIPGTILGAIISTDVTPDIFKILFGFVLIASSVYIFLRKQVESKEKIISKQLILLIIGSSFCRNYFILFWNRWRNCLCSINGCWFGNVYETSCSNFTIYFIICIIIWSDCSQYFGTP